MIVIFIIVLFVGLAVLPSLWVKAILARHSTERRDFPGTGGEFARHVLDGMGLTHVKAEEICKSQPRLPQRPS